MACSGVAQFPAASPRTRLFHGQPAPMRSICFSLARAQMPCSVARPAAGGAGRGSMCRWHPPCTGPRLVRTLASGSSTQAWWLQRPYRKRAGAQAVEKTVAEYLSAPSSAGAEAAQAALAQDKHAHELNARMSEMFARAADSGIDDGVAAEHQRLAGLTSVVSFSHQRMDTQEFLLETLEHRFSMVPPCGGDSVLLECHWTLSRMKIPGLTRQEYSATLVANDTRILRASDLESSVSEQAFQAIQEHLGATHVSASEFCWFLSFLATFPSDDAFDVVSAAMPFGR